MGGDGGRPFFLRGEFAGFAPAGADGVAEGLTGGGWAAGDENLPGDAGRAGDREVVRDGGGESVGGEGGQDEGSEQTEEGEAAFHGKAGGLNHG